MPATPVYPDALTRTTAATVQELLARFWTELAPLADMVPRGEHLLCAQTVTQARATLLEMMLALNGIAYPAGTRHLNTYLGASQRAAIERTLLLPEVSGEAWIGQAVALTVIYRWYAPQLVAAYAVPYAQTAEDAALAALHTLPDWPLAITTD
ncbi:MAG: hypothetical protein KAX65_15965 [Caldilineaceae bacterium]|nr:hypothetical protein [Caldilineaceae bacterium]